MPKVITDSQILEAALAVISQQSYAGATTREIAAAAGINEVTLFRRFGSKQKLLVAVVEQEAENFVAAGIDYTGDIEADLLRIVQFYRGLMESRGHVIAMLLNEIPRHPELLEAMQTPVAIIGKITRLLTRYQTEGILVAEPPLQAFLALTGPLYLEGMLGILQPNQFGKSLDPSALVRHYLQGRTLSGIESG